MCREVSELCMLKFEQSWGIEEGNRTSGMCSSHLTCVLSVASYSVCWCLWKQCEAGWSGAECPHMVSNVSLSISVS